jgi:hypothetical protein
MFMNKSGIKSGAKRITRIKSGNWYCMTKYMFKRINLGKILCRLLWVQEWMQKSCKNLCKNLCKNACNLWILHEWVQECMQKNHVRIYARMRAWIRVRIEEEAIGLFSKLTNYLKRVTTNLHQERFKEKTACSLKSQLVRMVCQKKMLSPCTSYACPSPSSLNKITITDHTSRTTCFSASEQRS